MSGRRRRSKIFAPVATFRVRISRREDRHGGAVVGTASGAAGSATLGPGHESGFRSVSGRVGPGRGGFFIRRREDHMFARTRNAVRRYKTGLPAPRDRGRRKRKERHSAGRGSIQQNRGEQRPVGAEQWPTGSVDMDYHQQQRHQFLMPPPASLPAQQLCAPMMGMEMEMEMEMEEQLCFVGRGGGGRGAERKRRFTEEQIRSLESMFHAHHAKLEPREKAELARELGLQPRQVAIWFQNKRARWRSKQLEHDFAALRADYDALHSRVESLKQEKLALAAQLHELSERLRERDGGGGGATASSSSCNGGGRELDDDKRNVVDVEPPESCVLGGTACATPELWEPWPWPPVEWNAVA